MAEAVFEGARDPSQEGAEDEAKKDEEEKLHFGGPVGAALVECMAAHGGTITADDLAGYRLRVVEPLRGLLLEVLLAGGGAYGIPTVPGVTPDLDMDGDGLESFELNAANEIAVHAFLADQIPFVRIVPLVQQVLRSHEPATVTTLEGALDWDRWGRQRARGLLSVEEN